MAVAPRQTLAVVQISQMYYLPWLIVSLSTTMLVAVALEGRPARACTVQPSPGLPLVTNTLITAMPA
jgi:hypothetical protein